MRAIRVRVIGVTIALACLTGCARTGDVASPAVPLESDYSAPTVSPSPSPSQAPSGVSSPMAISTTDSVEWVGLRDAKPGRVYFLLKAYRPEADGSAVLVIDVLEARGESDGACAPTCLSNDEVADESVTLIPSSLVTVEGVVSDLPALVSSMKTRYFWQYLTVNGDGYATGLDAFAFLSPAPDPSAEELEWLRLWNHSGPTIRSAQCAWWLSDSEEYLRVGVTAQGYAPTLVQELMNRACE